MGCFLSDGEKRGCPERSPASKTGVELCCRTEPDEPNPQHELLLQKRGKVFGTVYNQNCCRCGVAITHYPQTEIRTDHSTRWIRSHPSTFDCNTNGRQQHVCSFRLWQEWEIGQGQLCFHLGGLILQEAGKLLVKTVKVTESIQKRHPGRGNHSETICKASPSSHQCNIGKELYWSCSW